MRVALTMAERGMAAGGPPVGACLVKDDAVVASAHNSVVGELDLTAHAEVCVLRHACRELRSLSLAGCSLYVTLQPCAMCLAACFYAGDSEIYYGAPIEAMAARTGHELSVPPATLFAGAAAAPQLHGGVLADECLALLERWPGAGR